MFLFDANKNHARIHNHTYRRDFSAINSSFLDFYLYGFKFAGKKVGSLAVNFIRLALAILFFKEKVTLKEFVGAIIAVAGVVMLFMG